MIQTTEKTFMAKRSSPEAGSFLPEGRRYFSYNQYLRSIFGRPVYRVTIDAGFTCPNRDGTVAFGGCTYCNNEGFSPASSEYRPKVYLKPTVPVRTQIEQSLPHLKRRFGSRVFFAYFQAYSNTYAPVDELERLYTEALSHPDIAGLIVGTRPDCVDEDKLRLLERLARDTYVSVEYGCESVYDATLSWVNRGHDFACFDRTVRETAHRGMDIGAHIILGFPTETREQIVAMADVLSDLPLHFVKIHNLHIVRGTALAQLFEKQPFHVFDLPEYVELVCDFLERLKPTLAIQRLYGDASRELLIAPAWLTDGTRVAELVQNELTRRGTWQGSRHPSPAAS